MGVKVRQLEHAVGGEDAAAQAHVVGSNPLLCVVALLPRLFKGKAVVAHLVRDRVRDMVKVRIRVYVRVRGGDRVGVRVR